MLYEHIDTYEVGVDDNDEPIYDYRMTHKQLLRRAIAAARNRTGHREWIVESYDWYVDNLRDDVPYVARYVLRKINA